MACNVSNEKLDTLLEENVKLRAALEYELKRQGVNRRIEQALGGTDGRIHKK